MEPATRTRVKICCISSVAEAQLAVASGASALGLVSAMPSGPGVIDEALIAEIAAGAPPGVATFLLTSLQSVPSIIAQQRRCGANTLQLVDQLLEGSHADLRAALPGIKVVQVIHVVGEESVAEALAAAETADALLLDSGNPLLAIKELGGTGRRHNWALSRRIRESASVPLYLAGGLNPSNAAEAIAEVGPFGLDLCGGVRTHGHLDPTKLADFFAAVRSTWK